MSIGKILRIAAVSASVIAAAASATAPPSNNSQPNGTRGEPPILHPGRGDEEVVTETAIDGIEVVATPAQAAGWAIGIKNNTDALVSIVWDESTFVTSDGRSFGRIIRGETKRIDMAKAQPTTPVPSKASTSEVGFAEKLYPAEEAESEYVEKGAKQYVNTGGVSPQMNRQIVSIRKGVKRTLAGGALNITIQLADGKKTWIGRINMNAAEKKPTSSNTGSAGSASKVE